MGRISLDLRPIASRTVQARLLALLFTLGALFGWLTALLGDVTDTAAVVLAGQASVALVFAAGIFLTAPRVGDRLILAGLWGGLAAVMVGGAATRSIGAPFLAAGEGIGLLAALFARPRGGLLLVAVSSAAPFFVHDAAHWLVSCAQTITEVSTVAVVVWLRLRIAESLARLEAAAARDGLTGLLNRGAFIAAFEEHLSRVRRGTATAALVVFDLDHFKALNDTWGHAAGDEALRRVGAVLRSARQADRAGRLGGEEFAVLLVDADGAGGALAAAARLLDDLRAIVAGDRPLTASAGVALAPDHGVDAHSLMVRADRAMYEAKRAGRDRVLLAAAPAAA